MIRSYTGVGGHVPPNAFDARGGGDGVGCSTVAAAGYAAAAAAVETLPICSPS